MPILAQSRTDLRPAEGGHLGPGEGVPGASSEDPKSSNSYQFQCKGHEHQFNFNSGIQELIAAARSESAKMSPGDEKEILKKVDASLDKEP